MFFGCLCMLSACLHILVCDDSSQVNYWTNGMTGGFFCESNKTDYQELQLPEDLKQYESLIHACIDGCSSVKFISPLAWLFLGLFLGIWIVVGGMICRSKFLVEYVTNPTSHYAHNSKLVIFFNSHIFCLFIHEINADSHIIVGDTMCQFRSFFLSNHTTAIIFLTL